MRPRSRGVTYRSRWSVRCPLAAVPDRNTQARPSLVAHRVLNRRTRAPRSGVGPRQVCGHPGGWSVGVRKAATLSRKPSGSSTQGRCPVFKVVRRTGGRHRCRQSTAVRRQMSKTPSMMRVGTLRARHATARSLPSRYALISPPHPRRVPRRGPQGQKSQLRGGAAELAAHVVAYARD